MKEDSKTAVRFKKKKRTMKEPIVVAKGNNLVINGIEKYPIENFQVKVPIERVKNLRIENIPDGIGIVIHRNVTEKPGMVSLLDIRISKSGENNRASINCYETYSRVGWNGVIGFNAWVQLMNASVRTTPGFDPSIISFVITEQKKDATVILFMVFECKTVGEAFYLAQRNIAYLEYEAVKIQEKVIEDIEKLTAKMAGQPLK